MTEDELTLLARAAANGDDLALRDLVMATQRTVHRCCSHLASPADADDLTQDTYLRALRVLPRFRFDAPVLVWLLAIARHVCADHVRRRVRRATIDRSRAATPDRTLELATIEIQELIDSLDPDKRSAFVLTQLLGLSYEEAAAVCECPVGTIRSRVARARAVLLSEVRRAEAM